MEPFSVLLLRRYFDKFMQKGVGLIKMYEDGLSKLSNPCTKSGLLALAY